MSLQELKQQFLNDLSNANNADDVEALRIKYVSRKKGLLIDVQRNTDMKAMSPDEKKNFGKTFNELKVLIETELDNAKTKQSRGSAQQSLIDMSLPSKGNTLGSLHPITLVQMELEQICNGLGFMVLDGPEVETEFYNFDALNMPGDHPAREMQDTFWLKNEMLLRTHTSANQVRTLKRFGAPVKAIFPGRCFRFENLDASHENTFYQLEGLMVDKDISIANLISVMKTLLSQVFQKDVTVRLRPGFFPFVEPGFELDIECLICGGNGCSTCKQVGWLELLPCGLVHPVVLRHGGISPDEYSGFAFGLGLTRLAMMKYHIPDIRVLNSGDVRILNQFQAAL